MAEYEIQLTGEDSLAQLNRLCAVEPGVYGKRWNPDGSLAVMVRSERTAEDLVAALEQADRRTAAPEPVESPRSRTRRPEVPEAPETPAEPEA